MKCPFIIAVILKKGWWLVKIKLTRLVRQVIEMEISIYEAKTHFSKIIQDLVDGKEEIVIVSKNGKPIVQMTLVTKKNSKRIGSAKKEMEGYDISLDEFNAIPTLDFGL